MTQEHFADAILSYDDRRDIVKLEEIRFSIQFCVKHFIQLANEAINDHGYFSVALSGGSTPKPIFEALTQDIYRNQVDWSRLFLFWSDERAVPPTDPQSNYYMAMEAGFKKLPIPEKNIFRMKAEDNIEQNALEYEKILEKISPDGSLDLVMLGLGEDGHTASLFPYTHGLHAENRLVVANYIPKFSSWRMTLTYAAINRARHIIVYVMNKAKSNIVAEIFSGPFDPDRLPSQNIGTTGNKALWIL